MAKKTYKRIDKTVKATIHLKVCGTSYFTGGEPESDEQYSCRSDAHYHYEYEGVQVVKKGDFWDFVVSEVADLYYLVYVDYDTGDSFGRSRGHHENCFLSADRADAEAVEAAIEQDYRASGERDRYAADWFKPIDVKLPSGATVPIGTSTWKGYFESMNSVRIIPLVVLR